MTAVVLDARIEFRRGGGCAAPPLRLAVLRCEDRAPYGLEVPLLFCHILARAMDANGDDRDLHLRIYDCKALEYPTTPEEWDSYDGFLLPGSLSSAVDQDPWILRLGDVIRDELYARRRRTLGVCFGHQILAHALGGKAQANEHGTQVGGCAIELSPSGRAFLGADAAGGDLYLLCSHGDVVQALPPLAVSLGRTAMVPVQGAVYFAAAGDAGDWAAGTADPVPWAVTSQSHPEFSTEPGMCTLLGICDSMVATGRLPAEVVAAKREAVAKDQALQHSTLFVAAAMRALGWVRK